MGNETYRIRIGSPLLRPGIEIETEVSERYLVDTLARLLDNVREFNRIEKLLKQPEKEK